MAESTINTTLFPFVPKRPCGKKICRKDSKTLIFMMMLIIKEYYEKNS